jgi:glycosyltransferase involved in cell wall biosynthesis
MSMPAPSRSPGTLELSVVVPLFNEEESVDALHEEISRAAGARGRSYELLYVDDGSSDSTAEKLRAIAAADPHVKVVIFRRNYGQTAAIQAGFDQAQGNVIITMDGDLQNDPADFGLLLGWSDQGYDVVSGWRRDRKDKMISRRLPSMAANWLIGKLTGMRIHDNGCTLKAYRREVVKKASLYAEMHRFLAPMMMLSGCTYREVVVNHRARQFGRSKYGISRIWKVFLDLLTVKMLLGFITRPATWFGLLSIPFLAGAFLALALSAYSYLTLPPGMTYSLVFPSATVLFAVVFAYLNLLGMFAELVVKVGDFRENEAILSRLDRGGVPS